jgi:hypothetical protein
VLLTGANELYKQIALVICLLKIVHTPHTYPSHSQTDLPYLRLNIRTYQVSSLDSLLSGSVGPVFTITPKQFDTAERYNEALQ